MASALPPQCEKALNRWPWRCTAEAKVLVEDEDGEKCGYCSAHARQGKKVTFTVRFTEVGRGKMSWEAQLTSRSELAMMREIKRKGALGSSTIDFENGIIYVGGLRAVGRYEFLEPTP